MTQEQVIKSIQIVSAKAVKVFRFDIYDEDDLKQECFILALEALERFNGDSPLEAFLFMFFKNRLQNFKRKHFYRLDINCVHCETFNENCDACLRKQETQKRRRNLLETADIQAIATELTFMPTDEQDHDITVLCERIDTELLPDERIDYLKMKDDVYVPKQRKMYITKRIQEILSDYLNE